MAVKGLKQTSSIIAISGGLAESGVDTFTQSRIDLQLNPLDNEVFVVSAIDMNVTPPDLDMSQKVNTVSASLSTTSRTTLGTLAQSNVLAEAQERIQNEIAGAGPSVAFSRKAGEAPDAELPYLAIIATNDFFAQVEGNNNVAPKGFTFRVWGYRAQADASQYAALVQSEVLSN